MGIRLNGMRRWTSVGTEESKNFYATVKDGSLQPS